LAGVGVEVEGGGGREVRGGWAVGEQERDSRVGVGSGWGWGCGEVGVVGGVESACGG